MRTAVNVRLRRAIASSGMAAAIALGAALPAVAAGPAHVLSPTVDSVVRSAAAVQVRVEESCGVISPDTAETVEVLLSVQRDVAFPGSQPAALQRTKSCSSGSEYSDWGGVDVDPASPTAFFGSDPAPMCNGRWRIQPRADGGAWGAGAEFTVSRGPRAPTGLEVSVSDEDVTIAWADNPEPDLVGYRVERRSAGSTAWGRVSTVTSTSTVDRDVPSGNWEYRVVALRGDGMGVAACQDTTADLTAASAAETASVGEPEPVTSPSPGSTGGDPNGGSGSGTGDDGSTDGDTSTGGDGGDGGDGDDGGDGTTTGDTSDGDAGEPGGTTDGSDSEGGSSTGPTSPRRVAAPPPAVRTGPDASAPTLPNVAQPEPRERYYGEDEEYDPALDFGEVGGVEGERRTRTTVAERLVPQAMQEFVAQYVDPHRVLKPIAAGLVLVALALHLRRWSRQQHA